MSIYLKRLRRLTLGLIISGSFNILLLTLFVYWVVKQRPPTPYCELKPAGFAQTFDPSNSEVIRCFQDLSFTNLCSKLSSKRSIENGYLERDLALGCLVAYHGLNVQRALAGLSKLPSPRMIDQVPVFPGLTDAQFESVQKFVQTERWPFTTQSLFLRLKKGEKNPSLKEAFFFTPEFMTMQTLFRRASGDIDHDEILNVLLDGEWETFLSFTKEQREEQDLSAKRRQQLLLRYVAEGSKTAAYLILKTDGETQTKKLDDQSVLNVLKCLDEKTALSEAFAKSLLTSPRSDAVWECAAKRLYEYESEEAPNKFQHHAALSRFVSSEPMEQVKEGKPVYLYIVEEGDSLWKIANKHHVTIDEIVEANGLKTNVLQPGNVLEIPL